MTRVCEDGHWVDVETGEISDELCFDIDDMVEDHDLQHYSVTPPVPCISTRLRELAKENMVRRNYFLKGRELDRLLKKINMIVKYLQSLYLSIS